MHSFKGSFERFTICHAGLLYELFPYSKSAFMKQVFGHDLQEDLYISRDVLQEVI